MNSTIWMAYISSDSFKQTTKVTIIDLDRVIS